MKKLFVLFTMLLVMAPSFVSARIPHHERRDNRHQDRRYEHEEHRRNRNHNHRRDNDFNTFVARPSAIGGLIVGAALLDHALNKINHGQCFKDVVPGYVDGYGRFIQTGPAQRIQAPCQ